MRKCVFLLVLVLLLIGGCARKDKPTLTPEQLAAIPFPQRTGLPEASGGFVLALGTDSVTTDEVILPWIETFRPVAQKTNFEQFTRQARGQLERIVISRVSDILLYQQAKKNTGSNIDERLERAAEQQVRKFITSFGGDYARAEQALKRMGMDWRSFKEYQKKTILSHSYVALQLPEEAPISYSELVDCYNEMKEEFFTIPAVIKFRLIDIEVAKLEVADPNQSRRKHAGELANELMMRIRAGEDFGALAEEYSGVSFVRFSKPVKPESLAAPHDILAAQAEQLEPREIAEPIETETGEHIFIMKLEEKWPKKVEPFEKVQKQVEAKIIVDHRKKAVDELSAELMEQAALASKDEFIDFCLEEIYRICNQ